MNPEQYDTISAKLSDYGVRLMARKKKKNLKIYRYECTMTAEVYKTTRQAPSPDDLVSVNAYYELNPEEDDRPETVKKQLGVE